MSVINRIVPNNDSVFVSLREQIANGGKLDDIRRVVNAQLSSSQNLDEKKLNELKENLKQGKIGIIEKFSKLPYILRDIAQSFSEKCGAIKKANVVIADIDNKLNGLKPSLENITDSNFAKFKKELADIQEGKRKVSLTIDYLVNVALSEDAKKEIKKDLIGFIQKGYADEHVLFYLSQKKPAASLTTAFSAPILPLLVACNARLKNILSNQGPHEEQLKCLENKELLNLIYKEHPQEALFLEEKIENGSFDENIFNIIKKLPLLEEGDGRRLGPCIIDRIGSIINNITEENDLSVLIEDKELPKDIQDLATKKKEQILAEQQDKKIKELKEKIDQSDWKVSLELYIEHSKEENPNRVSKEIKEYAFIKLDKFIKNALPNMAIKSYQECYEKLIIVPNLKTLAAEQNEILVDKLVRNNTDIFDLCAIIVQKNPNEKEGSCIWQFRNEAIIRLQQLILSAEFISEDDISCISILGNDDLNSNIKDYNLKMQSKLAAENLKNTELNPNIGTLTAKEPYLPETIHNTHNTIVKKGPIHMVADKFAKFLRG